MQAARAAAEMAEDNGVVAMVGWTRYQTSSILQQIDCACVMCRYLDKSTFDFVIFSDSIYVYDSPGF